MSNQKSNKIRAEYRLAIGMFVIAVAVNVLIFAFVLLPTYSLVGNDSISEQDAIVQLERYENYANIKL